jgi:hypothetical protein
MHQGESAHALYEVNRFNFDEEDLEVDDVFG